MSFTIPTNTAAFNVNQSIWMQADIDAMIAAFGGTDVLDGCAVTAQGTPDMTVAVASGNVRVASTIVVVASGNVTITAADGTHPRIDLIVVNSSGTKSATAGTPAASPGAPSIPGSSVLLGMVYVPANDTTIASNQITDKRVINGQDIVHLETLSPTGTNFAFSKLGAFRHLRIVYSARGDQAALSTAVNLTFNGDTGSNYDGERQALVAGAAGAGVSGADQVAQASVTIAQVSAGTAPASYASGGEIVIPDYRGTTFFKTATNLEAGAVLVASAGNIQSRFHSGFWRSAAAITLVTATLASGNFVSGSTVSCYGVR